MSGVWSFHDKTHWYYVSGLTISWQNRLIVCLWFDHFMTKHTDTMSKAWPFHDQTDCYYVWGLIISWQNRLILCLGFHHYMTKHMDNISGLNIFITKQIDTISVVWPFHDKTDCTMSGFDQWVIHLSQWLNQKIYHYQ